MEGKPKNDVAIFCKSFKEDFDRLRLLLSSVENLNIDLPFLLSVPSSDLRLLNETVQLPRSVEVVADEDYTIPGELFGYGWLQQQVCKLSVYRTRFAKSYMMLDSDTYFVKKIDGLPETCDANSIVLSKLFTKFFDSNSDLIRYLTAELSPPQTIFAFGNLNESVSRLNALKPQIDELKNKDPGEKGPLINQIFCVEKYALQPGQFFHTYILEEFEAFLAELGLNFYDCIKISPWEYNWYACFAVSRWPGEIPGIVSPILHFASDSDVDLAISLGIDANVIARRFPAIQMAARHFERMKL